MAHANINVRQKFVSLFISKNGIPDQKTRVQISKVFNCSATTIYCDVVWILKPQGVVIYPGNELKIFIKERDGDACQYCGFVSINNIVDHVIPTIRGGYAAEYNLVCACQSCNTKKKSGKVWVPMNIELIDKINQSWANKIEALAIKGDYISVRPNRVKKFSCLLD